MRTTSANNSQPNDRDLDLVDRYWRAANYLSVGQVYLLDNALLREPLRPEHIKPRLLGHWGTTPGLNFIYAHLNGYRAHDLNINNVLAAPATEDRAWSPIPDPKAPILKFIRILAATPMACTSCFASSRFQAAFQAMPHRKPRAPLTKAASSATH